MWYRISLSDFSFITEILCRCLLFLKPREKIRSDIIFIEIERRSHAHSVLIKCNKLIRSKSDWNAGVSRKITNTVFSQLNSQYEG